MPLTPEQEKELRVLEAAEKGLKVGQFKEPLMRAAQKGSKELAVTHYILSQDPEYLKKIMDNEE